MKKVRIISVSSFFLLLIVVGIVFTKFSTHQLSYTKKQNNIVKASTIEKDEVKPPASNKKDLTKKVDEYLRSQNFNGSALVIQDGDTVVDKGYGYANLKNKTPNTPFNKYYIASVTKTVVATSILQLQEQKKLNINDNVNTYIPFFPKDKNITLYELLTHTSGISDLDSHPGSFKPTSVTDLVNWIGKQKLASPPATTWLYSDSNYVILAYIVEKVSGESLKQYVGSHIFVPAGMNDSGFVESEKIPNLSNGYRYTDKGLALQSTSLSLWMFGCGNMYSTTHDLYKLDKAIVTGKLLSPKSIQLMFTPVRQHNYGMSYYTFPEGRYSNAGIMSGWTIMNNFNWNKHMFVILLSNVRTADGNKPYDINREVLNLVGPPNQNK